MAIIPALIQRNSREVAIVVFQSLFDYFCNALIEHIICLRISNRTHIECSRFSIGRSMKS